MDAFKIKMMKLVWKFDQTLTNFLRGMKENEVKVYAKAIIINNLNK